MSQRITPVHWKTLIKVFELYGCKYLRKKGSHHILYCPGAKRVIVIPEYDEVDVEINYTAPREEWTHFRDRDRHPCNR